MSITLRTAHPLADEQVALLLDAAFHREGFESRIATELARSHPDFDPHLCWIAELDGEPAGCTLALRRRLKLRGAWVPLAVLAPIGVTPRFRSRGVGRALVRGALAALSAGGLRGAVSLGLPEFLAPLGFASAFDVHAQRVPVELLPDEGDTSAWRGLISADLTPLEALYRHSYGATSGCEERRPAGIEWESAAPRTHTLVHPGGRAAGAYLRFRVREELEIVECGVRDPGELEALLRMLRRLAREHVRSQLRTLLPPPHPVARELLARAALGERSNLSGGVMLCVTDWAGLLSDLAPAWAPILAAHRQGAVSLAIGGGAWRLSLEEGEPRVARGKEPGAHLWVPERRGAALFTGQRDVAELLFDPELAARSNLVRSARAVFEALLEARPAQWCYAPPYEIADA